MLRGIYTGAAGMMASWASTDVIANNLANVSTTGFKRDETIMMEFPTMDLRRIGDNVTEFPCGTVDRRPYVGELGTGVGVDEIFTYHDQGALRSTENPLDLALEGSGYFVVNTGQGERYTRDGSFRLDDQGYLADKNGSRVQGENGDILINDPNFSIDETGGIYVGDPHEGPQQEIARIQLANFDPPRSLRKVGDNYFAAPAGVDPVAVPADTRIKQGFIEQSNVNMVHEMVRLIEAHRAYGIEEKIVTSHDGLLGKVISELTR